MLLSQNNIITTPITSLVYKTCVLKFIFSVTLDWTADPWWKWQRFHKYCNRLLGCYKTPSFRLSEIMHLYINVKRRLAYSKTYYQHIIYVTLIIIVATKSVTHSDVQTTSTDNWLSNNPGRKWPYHQAHEQVANISTSTNMCLVKHNELYHNSCTILYQYYVTQQYLATNCSNRIRVCSSAFLTGKADKDLCIRPIFSDLIQPYDIF